MSALTLYEIHDELQAYSNSLELAETDAERAEIEARIGQWLQAGRDKVDSFNAFMSHLDSQVELAKAEMERINSIRRQIEAKQEQLRGYAVRSMEALGLKKLEGNTSSLALRLKPPSVVIEDEQKIPSEFVEVTIICPYAVYGNIKALLPPGTTASFAVSKYDVSKAIKRGEDVPGATLSMGGNSLVRR